MKKFKKIWKDMTKAEKRVEVAKDALRQLRSRRLLPRSGVYVCYIPEDKSCSVCALGALFCALPSNKRRSLQSVAYDVEEGFGDWKQKLRAIFSPKQLSLIESCFEAREFFDEKDNTTSNEQLETVAEPYLEAYRAGSSEREVMLDILTNIVKNKGTFKPATVK